MKILVLGVSGMLGNTVFNVFTKDADHEVYGTVRTSAFLSKLPSESLENIITGVDVLDVDALLNVFSLVKPELVINCIGITNKTDAINDPLVALPVNSILPHRLSKICSTSGSRLIHVSTDCVFSGEHGMYKETDRSDADHLYGKSKYIGELHDDQHAITLRTSIIGHGISTHDSLVDWFLAQEGSIKGYRKAIFSGLPTIELARIMLEFIAPDPSLSGLYHVSTSPIDKYRLLSLIAEKYNKDIEIIPDDNFEIDRSLDSSRFLKATGYTPPEWEVLVEAMYADYRGNQ